MRFLPFSSNNNERVKSPTYPASIWSRFGIKLVEGGGFPTTPLPFFFCPRGGPDPSLLMVPLTGTQQGERTHISPWGREFPLSLSRGKYGGLVHLCYFRRKPSLSLLSLGSIKTLYIPLILPGFISRGKKLLLNWGG
jgi:hypothetical protein